MDSGSELERDLKKVVRGEVRFDAYSRILYSTDASIYQIEPIGVVIPRDREDVLTAMEVARQHRAPVLPRGGGTSLAGQAIGRAVIFDFSKYVNRVLEVNAEERRARVEPGVVLDELNQQLRPHGLFFPPDPATANRCNIGGMIGNNACGARSIVYGRTSDSLWSLRLLLASGEQFMARPLSSDELVAKLQGSSHESLIYRELLRLVEQNQEEIHRRFPKILRREGGYNLDALLNRDPINLIPLLAGSEGTLAVVLEAELVLTPRPRAAVLLVAHFRELIEALEATQVILETGPSAVELLDKMVLDLTRGTQEYRRRMTFIEGDPEAVLVVEYSGDRREELTARLDQTEEKLCRAGLGYAFLKAIEPEAQANVWKVRKAGQGLLLGMIGDRKPATFVEDTAVAPEKLPAYVARFRQIVREHHTEAAFYAHASVGCLHIRPLIDLKQPSELQKMQAIAEAVSDLVLEFGGALSGEHGDGLARGPFNRKMFGPQLYEAFRQLKRAFDPHGLLNPGKIVDTPAPTENLRLRPNQGEVIQVGKRPLSTRFDFSRQGGFVRAIEMCSGVGACRKRTEGTMCPSYMVTNEEEHSTRGRAVLLQAAISGRLPQDELTSPRMFQALDLCLECKGCKGECPANVDMAKLKYEFLAHYYEQHRLPLRSLLFGEVARLNEAASHFASLYNWTLRTPWMRRSMERWLGIDHRRPLPPLARERFSQWFARRISSIDRREQDARPAVGLFVDTFTEFHYPSVGQAATLVLEAFGYRVIRLETKCCGRPLISKGLLDRAVENARANVAVLRKAVDQGIPIIGLEPSCLLTLRDEYPDLLPSAEARRIAANSFLLEEFLDPAKPHPNAALRFQPLPRRALFHGHCHLKALVGSEPSLRLLRAIPGLQVEEVDSGCCGMAGAFGFEKEHYEISMALAERRLAPAVRALPSDSLVIASGVSCRQQILHTTGRQPLHPAEVLQQSLVYR
ncbi:MAG: FAD-binding protein [Acidobacteria bacterium]|nr:FAD-binding protein [Acidobacteriota bacterium]